MDIASYWKSVREVDERIPGNPGDPIHIVSIADEVNGRVGGRVSAVNRDYGSRWIAQGSHRLASAEEIEAHEADQRERVAKAAAEEMKAKQTVRLETSVPQDQIREAVEAALANAKKPRRD